MADKYDTMIDAVAGAKSGDKYDQMIDAVASSAPAQPQSSPDYSLFQAENEAPQLPPGYGSGPISEGLLTNKPTGFLGNTIRSLPATAMALGTGTGPIGASAGEAVRQAMVSAHAVAAGEQAPTPGEAIGHVALAGTIQKAGDVAAPYVEGALRGIAGGIENAAVRFGKQFSGIGESVGRYVLGRGPSNVLTQENMVPGAAESALESAQSFLSGIRTAASKGVANAEDAILASGEAAKQFDTTAMADSLRTSMAKRGLTGSTAGLASGKGIGLLNEAQSLLDKGTLTGAELINVKRLLSDAVDYSGGRLPEVGSLAEGLIKQTAGEARAITNTAYSGLREANQNAQSGFGLYDKYRKFLGTSDRGPEVAATGDALRRIRLAFTKNPGVAAEVASDFGPQGTSQAKGLFDTIAAQHYTPNSPVLISPSSPILKGLSTIGLTGPQIAGGALKAAAGAGYGLNAVGNSAAGLTPLAAQAIQNYMSPESIAAFYNK